VIDLVLTPIGMKDAIETQRRQTGGRSQSPDDVSAVIDEALGGHDGRKFQRRFLNHAGSEIGVNIHHRKDCRRLREIERDIETVAYLHRKPPARAFASPPVQPT
jgi:hypothetical protein